MRSRRSTIGIPIAVALAAIFYCLVPIENQTQALTLTSAFFVGSSLLICGTIYWLSYTKKSYLRRLDKIDELDCNDREKEFLKAVARSEYALINTDHSDSVKLANQLIEVTYETVSDLVEEIISDAFEKMDANHRTVIDDYNKAMVANREQVRDIIFEAGEQFVNKKFQQQIQKRFDELDHKIQEMFKGNASET